MFDYFDAYTAAVVSPFLEENDFDLENVEMPEFNILNVPNSIGNTNENTYQTTAQRVDFRTFHLRTLIHSLSSNSVTRHDSDNNTSCLVPQLIGLT